MKLQKVSRRPKGKVRHSDYQTLGQRIKWLRAKQQPVMTQQQLQDRSGVSMQTIWNIEEDRYTNFDFNTLRKIAHALDCKIFINLMMTPSRAEGACTLVCPELPPLPKRTGKASVEARVQAAKALHYPWRTEYQHERQKQRIATSGKASAKSAVSRETGKHSKPPEQP